MTSVFRVTAIRSKIIWTAIAVVCGLLIASTSPIVSSIGATVALFFVLIMLNPLASLIFVITLSPLRALVATEAPPYMPSDIGQMSLAILLVMWVLFRISTGRSLPRPKTSPILISVGAFVIALGISGFAALSLTTWLREWLKWIQILLVVVFIMDVVNSRTWQWIVIALAGATIAQASVGLFQYFGGSGALHLLINEDNFRAFGTFGQPNPFGGFMGLMAPILITMSASKLIQLIAIWRRQKNISFELFCLAAFTTLAALMAVGGVYISYSRGSWLGFGASMVILTFSLPQNLKWGVTILIAGGLATGMLWQFGLVPDSIQMRLSTITNELFNVTDVRGVDITPANYAIVERLAHWQAALRMLESNQWLGVGAGNYEIAYADYRLINWDEALGHAHNYYLNVAAETGMIGLITYLTMWISVIWITWRTRHSPDIDVRFAVTGLLGSWTYLAVHSLTDNLYVNNLFLHIGVLLGLLACLRRQQFEHVTTLESSV